jgi:uncharacterized protein (TIGR03382 family)
MTSSRPDPPAEPVRSGSGADPGSALGSGSDGKADGQTVEAPSAGCSATGSGAGASGLFVMLGAVLLRRRRRA